MVGLLSDIGNIRKTNEDYMGFYEDKEMKIYIVADGMGGHNAGEVASKLAVDTSINNIKSSGKPGDLETILKTSIQLANKKIYDFSKTDYSFDGMGTTITACLVVDYKMCVANVGDSRCYVIEDNNIRQITKDHSLVQQLVDNGTITLEEAAAHPNKNIITRALGTAPSVIVDTYLLDLRNIRKVILCTDGLSNSLTENDIYETVINNSNDEACRQLIDLSNKNGGRDNITVIIFEGECKNDRNLIRQ